MDIELVDLFIQQGNIDQLIALWKSDKDSRKFIDSKLHILCSRLNLNNILKFEDIVTENNKSHLKTLIDMSDIIEYAINTKNITIIKYGISIVLMNAVMTAQSISMFMGKLTACTYPIYDIYPKYKQLMESFIDSNNCYAFDPIPIAAYLGNQEFFEILASNIDESFQLLENNPDTKNKQEQINVIRRYLNYINDIASEENNHNIVTIINNYIIKLNNI